MILWAQINFEETPKLDHYPTKGIFQIFVSSTGWEDMDDYKILFHKDPNQEFQTEFPFLTKQLYEESPINCSIVGFFQSGGVWRDRGFSLPIKL